MRGSKEGNPDESKCSLLGDRPAGRQHRGGGLLLLSRAPERHQHRDRRERRKDRREELGDRIRMVLCGAHSPGEAIDHFCVGD